MTPLLISILCLAMVGTSFLSGIFGMAGGMILVGILLAMHAGAGSDDAARRHADGVERLARTVVVAARALERGRRPTCSAASSRSALWSFARYVPSKPIALLLLGLTPFLVRLVPEGLSAESRKPPSGHASTASPA